MKLSIVIPCYNEEAGIENLRENLMPVLDELENSWELELLFIDDGSTDNTNILLHQCFADKEYTKIIRHSQNMNIGAGMRTGFSHATGDVIVTMDSDCTYDPQDIHHMLDLLDEETSIVTASPYHIDGKVEGVPRYRLLLSKGISTIYKTITGQKIDTFTALFRVQKRDVAKNVSFQSNDFLATAEFLIYAAMQGHKIKEYPTTLSVRRFGESKMKLVKVIRSHAKFVGKTIGMKLRGK